ncbi:hypothetical protein BJV74DRAFT_47658 [Russula compacta]|nr:hypothetical protein BJV74DRAFT_47658 [Russula compacta]
MVARPPPVLTLHLNRSVHFGAYASKNTARVHFPEVLDLTPFTTSGMLSTSPSFPISSHMHMPSSAAVASLATLSKKGHKPPPQPPRVLYRLAAVVCHYGQHSFGHYVCFRRKPRGAGLVVPPQLNEPAAAPGKGWLRVSDDAVREVGIEAVLQECNGAFMLYYERVRNDEDNKPVCSPHSRVGEGNTGAGEVGGKHEDDDDKEEGKAPQAQTYSRLQDVLKRESSEDGEEEEEEGEETLTLAPAPAPAIKARVVRSVSLGREDDVESTSVSVKQEAASANEAEAEVWQQLLLSSLTLAKPEPVEVESPLGSPGELPTSVVVASAEAPSPIPDAPAVDEPPIAVARPVDSQA